MTTMTTSAPSPIVTEFDRRRLCALRQHLQARRGVETPRLDALLQRLEHARVVGPGEIPSDVVTMNSLVALRDLGSGERFQVRLAFPGAPSSLEVVDVLSALGRQLLGARRGDQVVCPTRHGARQLEVDDVVYQPEATGNYHH